MSILLRDYQEVGLGLLALGLQRGHRAQIFYAATGSGKSVCAARLMERAHEKGTRSCFVVDRRAIVNQVSATLDRYNIPHGVIMADHPRHKPYELIQVASVQTLTSRGFMPDLKLLIVDECHAMHRQLTEYVKKNPHVIVVGMTATPFTKGLGSIYSNVVSTKTTNQLIGEKWLVPLKVYAAKAPDMTGAKVVAGEWTEQEIRDRGTDIIGDIIQEWVDKTRLHFGGPVKTIVFSASVDHGDELCRQFCAAGYNFKQISYKDGNNKYREETLKEFAKPDTDIHGLISCEALSKGFDQVDILCGISARPYRKSFSSHIQQIGRVMRPSDGKEYALWLDHSGNYVRFFKRMNDLFENGVSDLGKAASLEQRAPKEPTEQEKKSLTCSACGFVLIPGTPICPACGHERIKRSLVDARSGNLVEFNGVGVKPPQKPDHKMSVWVADKHYTWKQLCGEAIQRKKGNVDKAKKWALSHYKALYDEWPKSPPDFTQPPMTDILLRKRITAQQIRWAKSPYQRRRA